VEPDSKKAASDSGFFLLEIWRVIAIGCFLAAMQDGFARVFMRKSFEI